MALKAGRVGVNPKFVDKNGKIIFPDSTKKSGKKAKKKEVKKEV